MEEAPRKRRVDPLSDAPRLTGTQDAHFGVQAASWTDRYRSSPSFRVRLSVVGRTVDGLLRDQPRTRVLDFGGGTGVFSAVASRSASFTVCIDRSLPMLTAGTADQPSVAALLQSAGFDGSLGTIVRIAGDDRCVGALRASFDLILAISVLEYVPDAVTVLTRLAERLNQGGTLLITVPNRTSPVRIAQRIFKPFLARNPASTGRFADQSFVGLRPYGDNVPWQRAAAAAGLAVKQKRTLSLGHSGVRRWFHPMLIVSLGRPEGHRG